MTQAGSLHWIGGKTYLPLTWKVWFLQAIQEAQKIYEDVYDDYMKNPGAKVNSTIYRYHLAVSSPPELQYLVLLLYCHITL